MRRSCFRFSFSTSVTGVGSSAEFRSKFTDRVWSHEARSVGGIGGGKVIALSTQALVESVDVWPLSGLSCETLKLGLGWMDDREVQFVMASVRVFKERLGCVQYVSLAICTLRRHLPLCGLAAVLFSSTSRRDGRCPHRHV